ncbi:TadE/TadG family type IV pilus assembly protein [Parafrankia elaeagni]|uniref:TadE/TadG family type IV pilus assembly protein n=1 Tax=Parafrankia elaeagni TaxID=222534 RepID=UPI00036095F4|nr:TadE/TadG family type IV pilus assembly protein [Parafrankia elaeagni]
MSTRLASPPARVQRHGPHRRTVFGAACAPSHRRRAGSPVPAQAHPQVRRPTRRSSRDAGAVSVELVIATPLLMTMLLLVVQYALWAHASHIAATAARRGADAARAYGAPPTAGPDSAQITLDQLGDRVLTGTHIQLDAHPDTVTLTITGSAISLLPGFSLPVTGHATGAVERLAP